MLCMSFLQPVRETWSKVVRRGAGSAEHCAWINQVIHQLADAKMDLGL